MIAKRPNSYWLAQRRDAAQDLAGELLQAAADVMAATNGDLEARKRLDAKYNGRRLLFGDGWGNNLRNIIYACHACAGNQLDDDGNPCEACEGTGEILV